MAASRSLSAQDTQPTHREYDLSKLELSQEHRKEVQTALQQKDYTAAEKILVEEAERDPKSLRTAKLLEFSAWLFFDDGQYVNSVIAWKKAEAIAPLDERSQFTLAMAYIKVNHRSWARTDLEKLAAAHSENSLYSYWLARLDYDDQKYAEAIARLQGVIRLDPKMIRAYDLLGLCYDYTGRFDQAITAFSRAVELNRLQAAPSPWPTLDMAMTQLEINQLADAEKNLREAISYDPKLPQAQYQLGRVLDKEGKSEQAIAALKASAALDLLYSEPHYLLGRIYQKLGKPELAQAEVLEFQKLKSSASAKTDSTPSR